MGLQERLLDQVGGVDLALQPPADLQPGQQRQVVAVQLQQLPQGRIPSPARAWRRSCSGSGLVELFMGLVPNAN